MHLPCSNHLLAWPCQPGWERWRGMMHECGNTWSHCILYICCSTCTLLECFYLESLIKRLHKTSHGFTSDLPPIRHNIKTTRLLLNRSLSCRQNSSDLSGHGTSEGVLWYRAPGHWQRFLSVLWGGGWGICSVASHEWDLRSFKARSMSWALCHFPLTIPGWRLWSGRAHYAAGGQLRLRLIIISIHIKGNWIMVWSIKYQKKGGKPIIIFQSPVRPRVLFCQPLVKNLLTIQTQHILPNEKLEPGNISNEYILLALLGLSA